jgi:hypothetical protein
MLFLAVDDEGERDAQTIRARARRFEPNAVRLPIAGEIERAGPAIPGRRKGCN